MNTAEEIAQWVIYNRYPKSENEKISDAEMYNELVAKISELSTPPAPTDKETKKKNKPTDAYGGLGSELESGNMNYDAYYS